MSLESYKTKKLNKLGEIVESLSNMRPTQEVVDALLQVNYSTDLIENTVWRLRVMVAYRTAIKMFHRAQRASNSDTKKCNFCGEVVSNSCKRIRQSWGCPNNPDGMLN